MPYPPPYNRQFNFQNQQSLTPADPLPADEIDSEYNAIKLTLDATTANLQLIQRSDGALANESVGVDQLTPDIALLGNSAAEILAAAAAVEIAAAGVEGSEAAAAGSASSASSSATTASAAATAAQTAKTAAETAELNAEAAETTANISKTQAQAAALDAVAAAAKLTGASSTSTVIGTGSKTFTTDPGKFFDAGTWLLITSNANPAVDYMHGVATAYASTTLTVNVTNIGGSGTLDDWTIRVAGTQGTLGATGAQGDQGIPGAPGASGAPGIQFVFSTTTADSDPGPGVFRFNHATPASATALYIDNQEVTGTNVTAWLDSFDDAGDATNRGALQIIDPNNTVNFYVLTVTGSVVDGTGYRKVTIAYLSGAGTFTNGANISFAFFRRGPIGAAGPAVADGDKGDIVVSGSGAVYSIDPTVLTAFGRTVIDDVDGAAVRTTIGAGDVTAAAAFTTDERLIRSDGTGKGAQASTAALTDAGALSGLTSVSMTGVLTVGGTGSTAPVIDPSGYFRAPVISAPSTPPAGFVRFYAKADKHIYQIDDAGLETDLAAGGGAPGSPQGRLTLTSAAPVLTSTVSGAGTVYYAPCAGQHVPLYGGAAYVMTDMGGELSQALSDASKSPAAAVGWAAYDLFVWDDSGTKRCTRGPAWSAAATITVTIATPAVVSWTAHGLKEGDPVVFTTTGALPTGITAGTVYFVSRSPAANTFNISTTVALAAAGTLVATSGTQSGVHTCTCRVRSRGAGAGTTEIERVKGFWLNKNSITNGPAANRGTYVGTVLTNAAGTIDFTFGTLAAGGGKAVLSVWNAYNRFRVRTQVTDSLDTESYATATWKPFLGSVNNSVDFIVGLEDEAFDAMLQSYGWNSAAVQSSICVGYDSTNTFTGIGGSTGTTAGSVMSATYGVVPVAGRHTVTGLEYGSAGAVFAGDFAVPAQGGAGLTFMLRM